MAIALLLVSLGWTARTAGATTTTQSVTLGMGYVPNVQFAPFYVAQQRGYYRAAGLNVTFSYGSSPNLLQLVGAGRVAFAIADGTDAIAAESQGIPVESVLTLYRRLPVSIFALKKSGIRSVAALRGKSVGVPGRYGSTYVGLLAALKGAGLTPSDVNIKSINFTQAESVARGTVDAAVGYSNNEPVLLQRRGYHITSLEVGSLTGLVGPGVVAGSRLASANPSLVRRFVQATLHGLADTIRNPGAAFNVCKNVSGLRGLLQGSSGADQYAVLLRSIQFWHDAGTRTRGLGYALPAQWKHTIAVLHSIGQIQRQPAVSGVMTDRFVAGSAKE